VLREQGVGEVEPVLYAADQGNHPVMCAVTRPFCSSRSSLTLNLLHGSFSFSFVSILSLSAQLLAVKKKL
jgi:hypothetical protein